MTLIGNKPAADPLDRRPGEEFLAWLARRDRAQYLAYLRERRPRDPVHYDRLISRMEAAQ